MYDDNVRIHYMCSCVAMCVGTVLCVKLYLYNSMSLFCLLCMCTCVCVQVCVYLGVFEH